MSDDLTQRPKGIAGLVTRITERLGPPTRRNVFVGAAVAGSAMATDAKAYTLTPTTAYATICGPGNTAASGWTVFCSTINGGKNTCPPGSFAAGWWKAADSTWCGGGYRYIVDCNARCTGCTSGCSDGICDSRCWSCSCGTGSTATCDQRRICCNAFRYGQCNTHVACSGGVHCRVTSCVAPYKWDNCTTLSLRDDRTSEHSAPSIPQWGVIQRKYVGMGADGSWLGYSMGPVRSVGDGRGTYVQYRSGYIYNSSAGTVSVRNDVWRIWAAAKGTAGALRYPRRDRFTSNNGWIQLFEGGAILGHGTSGTHMVYGPRWPIYVDWGRETGVLGFPKTESIRTTPGDGGWIQIFQGGCIVDGPRTSVQVVNQTIWVAWMRNGREGGPLRYPKARESGALQGEWQAFEGGEIYAMTNRPGYAVRGAVLTAWKAAGGINGRYGWPVSDTTATPDGRLTCQFQNGTITA